MSLTWPAPFPSERQTGGPEVTNSHAPKARGLGYGAAGPMSNRRVTRTPCIGPQWVQVDLFEELPEGLGVRSRASGAPHGAARSAA